MFPPGRDAGPNRSKINRWFQQQLDFEFPLVQKFAPTMRYNQGSIVERDAAVERLREFLRLNYMTGAQVAKRIGVRAETLYPWLQGKSRPKDVERIIAFLHSMPAERGGIMPTGYEYREYRNWRGIPKPRRCPFCKQAKGEIRKVRGSFAGVCPNFGATGPRRESQDEALGAWNGKV